MVLKKKKKKKILDTPQHNGRVEKNFYFLFSKLKLIKYSFRWDRLTILSIENEMLVRPKI
jgi:hypothetical protein